MLRSPGLPMMVWQLFLGLLIVAVSGLAGAIEEEPPPAAPVPAAAPRTPQLTVLSTSRGPNGALVVEVEVAAADSGVQIQPLFNGQPLRSFSIAQTRNLSAGQRYTVTLPIASADGVLALVARDAGTESAPAVLRLRRGAPEQRPALYVLSVGVGRYTSADIPKLRYPAKDAGDLARTLKGQRDTLYREVTTRVLVDGQATRQAVMAGFDWLQASVGSTDTAVVFLAGHGTNEADGSYYYLPADAQPDSRASMIPGDALHLALAHISGRVVLMLDTCHSGNVLGRRSLNRLISELTAENRIVVFAASTGDQTARESPAWQNGAFTKAIVEGLRGVADYAEDGKISVSELETWAGVRVGQLTAGAQTPTLAKPNAVPDYVVSALPPSGVLPNPKQALRRKALWGAGAALVGIGTILTIGLVVGRPTDKNIVMLTF